MLAETTENTNTVAHNDAQGPPHEELTFTSAHELAAAIRAGRASALEVVDAHLEQIEAYNSALNAVVTLDADGARDRAREADAALARSENWGPLHGVPVTIKDGFEIKGVRTTGSYKPLSDYVPERNPTVVARLRDAGAIILGKTNMSLLAADFQTDSPIFGRTNNPWDRARTPGGSSGGSGAAVAAGLSPLDVASDLGGSVRIPAHYCGVFGLKPTEHRVPATGHIPDWCIPGWFLGGRHPHPAHGYLRSPGPLVADLEFCLSLIEGPDGRDASVPPIPQEEVPERPLSDYQAALSRRYALINRMEEFLSEWDAWLCPVSPTPAFTHRRTGGPLR